MEKYIPEFLSVFASFTEIESEQQLHWNNVIPIGFKNFSKNMEDPEKVVFVREANTLIDFQYYIGALPTFWIIPARSLFMYPFIRASSLHGTLRNNLYDGL